MRAYNHISKPCLPNLRVVSDTFNFIPCQLSQLNITCAFPHECFSNDGALQIRAGIFTHRGFDLLQLQSAAALVGTKQLSHHGRSGLNLKPQLPRLFQVVMSSHGVVARTALKRMRLRLFCFTESFNNAASADR
jgi:hypothetical protein